MNETISPSAIDQSKISNFLTFARGLLFILRQGNKLPVLIDFGLAREFEIGKSLSLTDSKTPGYAPPEQYQKLVLIQMSMP